MKNKIIENEARIKFSKFQMLNFLHQIEWMLRKTDVNCDYDFEGDINSLKHQLDFFFSNIDSFMHRKTR